MQHTVIIEKELPEDKLRIIKDYWSIKGDVFVNKPSKLRSEYNLNQQELIRLIRDNSRCKLILNYCDTCSKELSVMVSSQQKFKDELKYAKKRCEQCTRNAQIEFQKRYREIQEQLKKVREQRFNKSIDEKQWKELNTEQLSVLKQIVSLKTKKRIYEVVFSDNPFDKSKWKIVNAIEAKGLIEVLRNDNGHVLDFDFSKSLEQILDSENSIEETLNVEEKESNVFRLSLTKNINNKVGGKPDYSGVFFMSETVKLIPDVKYIYGGWSNTDGSIYLKIQPVENLSRQPEQRPIEAEPDSVRKSIEAEDDIS